MLLSCCQTRVSTHTSYNAKQTHAEKTRGSSGGGGGGGAYEEQERPHEHLRFADNPHRMNVALSRARHHLIILVRSRMNVAMHVSKGSTHVAFQKGSCDAVMRKYVLARTYSHVRLHGRIARACTAYKCTLNFTFLTSIHVGAFIYSLT